MAAADTDPATDTDADGNSYTNVGARHIIIGIKLVSFFLASAVILSGILAPADAGVLERVEARRVANGWGLDEAAGPGVLLLAVDD